MYLAELLELQEVTDIPQKCSSEIWVLNLISGLNLSFSSNLSGFACTKLLHLLGCVGNSLLLLETLALQFPIFILFFCLHAPDLPSECQNLFTSVVWPGFNPTFHIACSISARLGPSEVMGVVAMWAKKSGFC